MVVYGTEGLDARVHAFFEQRIGRILRNKNQRASYAMYAQGLLGDGERKSMEPLAARACGNPDEADAYHQRLTHFIGEAEWDDAAVRKASAEFALEFMTKRGRVETWIIDDTGFLKQGRHSVGVQRQYTGSAGKVTNCQIGVSLSLSNGSDCIPVDFELYLPKQWAEDADRRREAKIPQEVVFRTKPQLALQMIRRALETGLPKGVLLADEAYGNSCEFRCELRRMNLNYAVAISSSTKVWLSSKGGHSEVQWTAEELATSWLGRKQFRATTWRQGTKGLMMSKFAARQVLTCHDNGAAEPEPQWLLIEWPDGEAKPTAYFLLTLPRATARKKLVKVAKERWRTERVYEDLKGELGLDHFEGRRYRGWHHHISVAISCFAFIVAERCRAFPPSREERRALAAEQRASGTALRGLIHYSETGHCSLPQSMATSLPDVPFASTISCDILNSMHTHNLIQ